MMMHYGILAGGKIHHVECDPSDLGQFLERFKGEVKLAARSLEEYDRRLEEEKAEPVDSWPQ